MKGVLPAIAIAAIAFAAIIVIWGMVIYFLIGEHETVVRSGREMDIIKLINEMEWNKRIIPQVIKYSFYQSSYDLGTKGGYFNPDEVSSYNCIPYWRIYDNTYFPDIQENLNKTILYYMNEYANALGMNLPQYNISYQETDEGIAVNLTSDQNLEMSRGSATVGDRSDFATTYNYDIFKIFETGKKFVEENSLLSAVENSASSCGDIKDKLSTELKSIEANNVELEVEEAQSDCNGHSAAIVLVKITDTQKYPVYDYSENTTTDRNMQLRFYVLVGNSQLLEAKTNVCGY